MYSPNPGCSLLVCFLLLLDAEFTAAIINETSTSRHVFTPSKLIKRVFRNPQKKMGCDANVTDRDRAVRIHQSVIRALLPRSIVANGTGLTCREMHRQSQ